jgi:hypothetical protein
MTNKITTPSFRFGVNALAEARVAAKQEGVALSEFVRRAVDERVRINSQSADAIDVRRLVAVAEKMEATLEKFGKDVGDVVNTAGRGFRSIEQRMADMLDGVK